MPETPGSTAIRWGVIARIVIFILLVVAGNLVARHYMDVLKFPIRVGNEDLVHRTILVSAAIYSILLAIPFVPGAEIGLALLTMLGPRIAILVYICTLGGLALAFLVGRLIPLARLAIFCRDLKLERTSQLLSQIEPLNQSQRLALLLDKAPKRFLPVLIRYRYLALAVALNIPGNYMIGGGGGISLLAGVSRLYSVSGFLLTIVLAVAPVPFAVMLFGVGLLD